METKLAAFDGRILRDLGGNIMSRGMGVDAAGSAGGLLTLWNEDSGIVDQFFETNARENASWARLDRFLISPEILSWFLNLAPKGHLGTLSDHNAIMIGESKMDWGPGLFRFYNGWLEDNGLMKMAMEGWSTCNATGSKGYVISLKFRDTKMRIKRLVTRNKLAFDSLRDCEAKLAEVESKAIQKGWERSLGRRGLF
ncbi:hypothetical protein Dsin_016617 [Dipteronia sinensis]|uniref:Uncharacterized protein n=1 Tax=Dipteronia sinensis TaxID=43782 RepID=A0AAE0E5N7_9ROSI|nr:hypothetical protein Dsin_016617 [Dipteronia sinensis]